MLLTNEEIKEQTRGLWKKCFHDSEEFMDIYFDEKYSDDVNMTLSPDGDVAAAMQLLPYSMSFYGLSLGAGYISGLCTDDKYRKQGLASQLLRAGHRRLYDQGAVLSFLIPGSDDLRHFYEKAEHGAYWTATFRKETEIKIEGEIDEKIEITQPEQWGHELYVFYRQHTAEQLFMLHPGENDFFAALETCDLEDGLVLVARRKRRLLGVCLVVKEKDGRCFLRSMIGTDSRIKDAFLHYIMEHMSVNQVFARVAVPGSAAGAKPYAMARVVNVEKLLQAVLAVYPTFQLHIGVDGDLDIPENNGYYFVDEGRVTITDEKPGSIVTPGGLAAMLLGAHPTMVEMMLDE